LRLALELIKAIQQNGGNIRVEDGNLKISPRAAALPIMQELKTWKPEIIAVLQGAQTDGRKYWRARFAQWVEFSCVRHPRCFGGLGCLYLSFCKFMCGRNEHPCSRETFRGSLAESAHLTGEINGTTLVSGIVLRSDVDGLELDPIPPRILEIPFESDACW